MGSVWVAERLNSPTQVAVKFLAARVSRDRDSLARFRREASAVAKIESPHVVTIFENGATETGTPYIVMELLDGETLGERLLRVGRIGLDDLAAILRQIASALDAAHRIGIVHRDIKPDNIFIVGRDDFPLVKLLDFGMAKQTFEGGEGSEITRAGVAVGTPEYMSPEQVLGGKDVDHRSDLWALGVVAYRALAGVTPFAGESPHALFFAICRGAYRPLEEVGVAAAFDAWFRLALSPKKPTRFESGGAMITAFDLVLREVYAAQDEVEQAGERKLNTLALPPSMGAVETHWTPASLIENLAHAADTLVTRASISNRMRRAAALGKAQAQAAQMDLFTVDARSDSLVESLADSLVDSFVDSFSNSLSDIPIVSDLVVVLNSPTDIPFDSDDSGFIEPLSDLGNGALAVEVGEFAEPIADVRAGGLAEFFPTEEQPFGWENTLLSTRAVDSAPRASVVPTSSGSVDERESRPMASSQLDRDSSSAPGLRAAALVAPPTVLAVDVNRVHIEAPLPAPAQAPPTARAPRSGRRFVRAFFVLAGVALAVAWVLVRLRGP